MYTIEHNSRYGWQKGTWRVFETYDEAEKTLNEIFINLNLEKKDHEYFRIVDDYNDSTLFSTFCSNHYYN